MKRLIIILVLGMITGIVSSADDRGFAEYRNLQINFNTHEATLAGSEKVMPVYTELKYNFNKGRRVSPFIKGDFGFSYVDDMEESSNMRDMTSNNYSSMGVGMDVGYLSMEAAYTTYQLGYQEEAEETSENRVMLKLKYRY